MPSFLKTASLLLKLRRAKNNRSGAQKRSTKFFRNQSATAQLRYDLYNRLLIINRQEDEDAAVRNDVWN
jgi:hypothetical protein